MNSTVSNRRYWRSLDETKLCKEEFPSPWDDAWSRRGFLKALGASAALSGLTACTREPVREIVPYVTRPEEVIPGKPLHYATAMAFDGFAIGLLVESHEGHPTKIEGNPSHPASLGATGIFEQAALLDLYNPNRARAITHQGGLSSYPSFLAALNDAIRPQRVRGGAGLRVLTHSITSPALVSQLEELLQQFPEAHWHRYQPVARDNTWEGALQTFGHPVETRFHLDRARIIVLFDSDCLFSHPAATLNTRQFAGGRRIDETKSPFSRLYAVEPTPSLSGSVADHRLAASAFEVEEIAFALAAELGLSVQSSTVQLSEEQRRWVEAVAADLRQNSGASLLIVGEPQPPHVHALIHLINDHLGNVGLTLEYAESADAHWVNHNDSMAQLVADMDAGRVECLLILGGNPVFDTPPDAQFGARLARVNYSVHLNSESNETSALCAWHVPESHFLESWGDARAFDGTKSIVQPLIIPLYESKTALELLHYVLHEEVLSDYEIVRRYWQSQNPAGDFEIWWRQTLHDGFVANSQQPPISVGPRPVAPPAVTTDGSSLDICFRPDPTLWDGRFANNGWLQELPKPFSKVTWDNPALISPALAKRMALNSGDVVELRVASRALVIPVWITPGQAENTVTVHFGGGRADTGFNGYQLRASENLWNAHNVELVKTGRSYLLSSTQHIHSVEGRDILESHEPHPPDKDTLYNPEEFKNAGYAWGMVIDLNACVGCSACTIACQAENNIPVVGKDQVAAGRDMAWIRIDAYFEGGPDNPRIHHQPVACMQCENAPCELVCPVGATLHDHEGLNLQVYNRCVGTRYCSNNCPYKVRRFNFFRYADYETPSLKPMRNPNVTVRWRGVMEKCTYCIQRIRAAHIASELGDRPIHDGEIRTACQQVCPAKAITFGNINDPDSAVSKLKASPLNFSMLGELNTRPRTTYLQRLRNTNPHLEGES